MWYGSLKTCLCQHWDKIEMLHQMPDSNDMGMSSTGKWCLALPFYQVFMCLTLNVNLQEYICQWITIKCLVTCSLQILSCFEKKHDTFRYMYSFYVILHIITYIWLLPENLTLPFFKHRSEINLISCIYTISKAQLIGNIIKIISWKSIDI